MMEVTVGETSTLSTMTPTTETGALSSTLSEVAVICADPAALAIARPVDDTVTIPGFELVQLTDRPARTLPSPSRGVAENCIVSPVISEALVGDSATDATAAGSTVREAAPDCWSLDAVMDAVPTRRGVTCPVAETTAIVVSELRHVTCAPDMALPDASRTAASNDTVPPMWTLALVGSIEIEAAECGVSSSGADVSRQATAAATMRNTAMELARTWGRMLPPC